MTRWNKLTDGMNNLADCIKEWREDKGFQTHWGNVPEKLMLVVTELSEAMEAYRHLDSSTLHALNNAGRTRAPFADTRTEEQSDWLDNFEEELADTFIRLLDLTGSLRVDIAHKIASKMQVNEGRPTKHGKEC